MPEERLEVLLTEHQIQERVRELATSIRHDLEDQPFLAIGVLKGSFLFLADLVRHLGSNVSIDFVQTSSYSDQKSTTGVVQIRKDLDISMEGKHVLIVEDIVDSGLTLAHLRELLGTRKPKTLRVVSLLSKPEARKASPAVEYVGFEIPNAFVVGYGLDYAERYRNLPYIAILHES